MFDKFRKAFTTTALLTGLALTAVPAWAQIDYSSMTNEDLAAMRGTMRDATPEDRDAFRQEWQGRVQNMSPEERQQVTGRPSGAGGGDGYGYRSGGGQRGGGGYGRGMGGGRR